MVTVGSLVRLVLVPGSLSDFAEPESFSDLDLEPFLGSWLPGFPVSAKSD